MRLVQSYIQLSERTSRVSFVFLMQQTASIYDRQLRTAVFKRLHTANSSPIGTCSTIAIGPGSYNPRTIDEIYRHKSPSRYGSYYQQSKRFPFNQQQYSHV
jgi:hypothetical protein